MLASLSACPRPPRRLRGRSASWFAGAGSDGRSTTPMSQPVRWSDVSSLREHCRALAETGKGAESLAMGSLVRVADLHILLLSSLGEFDVHRVSALAKPATAPRALVYEHAPRRRLACSPRLYAKCASPLPTTLRCVPVAPAPRLKGKRKRRMSRWREAGREVAVLTISNCGNQQLPASPGPRRCGYKSDLISFHFSDA